MQNLIKPNLFNGRLEILLSREDIYEIAKYAIEKQIIDVAVMVPYDEHDAGILQPAKLHELDYRIERVEEEADDAAGA